MPSRIVSVLDFREGQGLLVRTSIGRMRVRHGYHRLEEDRVVGEKLEIEACRRIGDVEAGKKLLFEIEHMIVGILLQHRGGHDLGGLYLHLRDLRLRSVQGNLFAGQATSRSHAVGPSQSDFAIVTTSAHLGTFVTSRSGEVTDYPSFLASPARSFDGTDPWWHCFAGDMSRRSRGRRGS